MKAIPPLLSVGQFGTHLVETGGVYSFTGTVPFGLKHRGYSSEKEGIAAFASWFSGQELDFRREHIGNLRNDVFALVLSN